MAGNYRRKLIFINIRRDVFVCLLLLIATFAVYGQVSRYEFVNYDDDKHVTGNSHVQAGLTLESIRWSLTTFHEANWQPIIWLSYMLDCQLHGMDPGWFHLTNIFFHILNALLLFYVFRMMTGDLWRSGFVAALFALHPLHVESVAWVTERKDVISTFFWMLTMWSYIRYVARPGLSRYLLTVLFFMFGLMSKPMLVTLPFVLLLLDYWPLSRYQFGQSDSTMNSMQSLIAPRLVWEKIPLFALSAAACFLTFYVQQKEGAVASLDMHPFSVRIANALVSYVGYIAKMIWPVNLAVLYPHPHMLPWWQASGACLLLISISIMVIKAVKQQPCFAVGWLWYIGTLVPVIGLVQVGSQAMADRYTYVPLIGIFMIISWGVPELAARWRYKKIGFATAGTVILSILTAMTGQQIKYWKNSNTLFEHALDVTDNNYLAHNNLGRALEEQGRTDDAISHYTEALQINPDYETAQYNLGLALAGRGRIDEAVIHYTEALQINPDSVETHNNLGIILFRKRKIEEAIAHFQKALRIKPDSARVLNNLKKVMAVKRNVMRPARQ